MLTQLAGTAGVSVTVSIATMDPKLAREIEPTVAPPQKRLYAVEKLACAGIQVNVALAPILPQITDSERNIESVVRAARDAGASAVWHNTLHLHEVTRDAFFGYLRAQHPELIAGYAAAYRGKYAPRAVHDVIERRVHAALRRFPKRHVPVIESRGPIQISLPG